MLTASVQLNVPALPDTDVWFQNAAAWSNYWSNINLSIEFDAIENRLYVPANDVTSLPVYMNIGGIDYALVTKAMLDELRLRVNTLEQSYRDLRTDLYDGGLITNTQ